MKKQLLAGTALVAAAMFAAGGATAQDKMKKKMMTPSISVTSTVSAFMQALRRRAGFIRARGDAGQVLSTVAFREVDPPCAGGGGLQFASCAVDPLASGVPARFALKNALYSSGTIPYGLSRVHRCFASCGGLRAA